MNGQNEKAGCQLRELLLLLKSIVKT